MYPDIAECKEFATSYPAAVCPRVTSKDEIPLRVECPLRFPFSLWLTLVFISVGGKLSDRGKHMITVNSSPKLFRYRRFYRVEKLTNHFESARHDHIRAVSWYYCRTLGVLLPSRRAEFPLDSNAWSTLI